MEPAPVRTNIVPSDLDAHDNVVLWDHGPQEPRADRDSAEYKAATADAEVWHKQHGGIPVPLRMHVADARHALGVEPMRYALEPREFDDAAVDAKVKEIQDQRAEAAKVAAERAEAAQLAADRKAAIAAVRAERAAAFEAEKSAPPEDRRRVAETAPPRHDTDGEY